ncbi:MAG: hypothetical protein WAT79_00785 [Saprospiraceae bacterium]
MKKRPIKTILYIIFLFFNLAVEATNVFFEKQALSHFSIQGFCSDTTDLSSFSLWRKTNWYLGGTKPEIIQIFVDRDTIINDRFCRVLRAKFDDQVIEGSDLPVYNKGNKMFFYEEGQWWLLYDFSAKQGDTVEFFLSKKTELFTFGRTGVPPLGENPYKLVVEKVDTVLASDGSPLKRFLTRDLDQGVSSVYGMNEIIEDIGSLFGLFGHFYIFTAEDWRYQFLCYKNDNYTYPNENGCSLTSSTNLIRHNIKITPNPVSDIILVTLEEYIPQYGMIHMHDATGQKVLSKRIYYGHNHLDLSMLPAGLFFWTVEDGGVLLHCGKVMKMIE